MATSDVQLVNVTAENVEETGFFCFMSKKKSQGYQNKLTWLRNRFSEGMRIKMLPLPERGFIEYIPGESAWRSIHADGYMVIHCLWVVGKSKKKGFSRLLLDTCIDDARRSGMRGVAVVTSEKVWMVGKKVFEGAGFELVESADPAFSLMVHRFGNDELPSFAGEWEAKAELCGEGLTVLYADQCPYIPDAVALAVDAATEAGRKATAVHLETRSDLMQRSPSPYGVFGMVLDGELLAYHYLLKKDLVRLLGV